MLEQFKVKEEDAVRVQADALRTTTATMFERLNVPPEDAQLAADVMVTADLRGVDSHGVSNMLRVYIDRYRSGVINPRPNWRVVRETPATANVDSDRGLGIIIAPKAMELAIQKARETGVGVVTVGNGRHLGMASYHAMLALKHDMIGVCLTNASPHVLPTFGREPRLGTNPIAVAVPAQEEPPFVFDAATSAVPENKIVIARRLGATIPAGWLADAEGTPIMEPLEVAPEVSRLLPLGSTREQGSHKGYGLACVVDILTGILSGSAYGPIMQSGQNNHFLAAYDIEAFTPVAEFKTMMDEYLRALKATPPAPGHDRVLVAGQPEWETEQERRQRGIPLHPEVIQWFQATCAEMDIPYRL